MAVSVEQFLPGGHQLAPTDDAAARYAQLLARLVALAPPPAQLGSLTPAPPRVGWDHPGSRLWPDQDDTGRDLNTVTGPAWLEDAASAARALLQGLAMPAVIGHGDWESQNLRWQHRTPYAVHDWDSVIAQPEPAILGAAAAVWPAAGQPGQAATLEQAAAFINAYTEARPLNWTSEHLAAAWAGGIWVRAVNAKKDVAQQGGPQLELLARDINDRRLAAGI